MKRTNNCQIYSQLFLPPIWVALATPRLFKAALVAWASTHQPREQSNWTANWPTIESALKAALIQLSARRTQSRFKRGHKTNRLLLHLGSTTFHAKVRTSSDVYLFATSSFADSNDWLNCLRIVAFGSAASQAGPASTHATVKGAPVRDVLLTKAISAASPSSKQASEGQPQLMRAPRQRQPSCKRGALPPPPASGMQPVFASKAATGADTITPTVHALLLQSVLGAGCSAAQKATGAQVQQLVASDAAATSHAENSADKKPVAGEENMLYCSIEDNPNEHTYRVKVVETELALRCQLKCYARIEPTTVSAQYEQLPKQSSNTRSSNFANAVTFYQLIVGPQELTLLNDYATETSATVASATSKSHAKQQQGLWSWPYQCIRRYSFDMYDCFVFEAGRKCSSGPGEFIVQTPKAQHIYKDVVNFVNELCTLATTNTTTSTGTSTMQVHQSNCVQIPIQWPSNEQHSSISTQLALNPTSNACSLPPGAILSKSQPNLHSTSQKEPLTGSLQQRNRSTNNCNQLSANNSPTASSQSIESLTTKLASQSVALTSDETDESGYDQCSDSFNSQPESKSPSTQVDSQSALQTTTCTNPTNTQISSCNAGSGNQSKVRSIQKSFEEMQHRYSNSSCAQTQTTPQQNQGNKSSPQVKLLGELIGGQNDALDIDLIRDIYTDITQEAKFAIVTNSSSASSAASDDSIASTCATHQSSRCSSNECDESEAETSDDVEESFNNRVEYRRAAPKLLSCRTKHNTDTNPRQNHFDLDCESDKSPCLPPRPAYLRTRRSDLHPIPECNDTEEVLNSFPDAPFFRFQQQQAKATNGLRLFKKQQMINNNNNNNINNSHLTTQQQESPKRSLASQLHNNNTDNLPQRHYYINNVKYTKVSKF